MCRCMGEIPGSVHGLGESEIGQGRRSSDNKRRAKEESHSGNTPDPECDWRIMSVINQEYTVIARHNGGQKDQAKAGDCEQGEG